MNLLALRTVKFRPQMRDTKGPRFLWSDDEVNGYIVEAQNEAAIRCDLIYDRTGPLTTLATVIGEDAIALDPLFYKIERVFVDGKQIRKADTNWQERYGCDGPLSDGPPSWWVKDRDGSLRFDKPASAVWVVRIEGYRLPMPLVLDADECEIPEKWQTKMLHWAYKCAKEKEDLETERPGDAARHEADFDKYFRPVLNVDAQQKQGRTESYTVRSHWGF